MEQMDYWQDSLIGYVIGDMPYLKSMENYVGNSWSCEIKHQILAHDSGYFIFRFNSVEDRIGYCSMAHILSITSPLWSRYGKLILNSIQTVLPPFLYSVRFTSWLLVM